MTIDERYARIRIAITVVTTLMIWSLLAWQALHAGVPAHHILNRRDMAAISNWWGALLIPALTWFLLGRIKPRATTRPKLVLLSFAAGALVGTAQAVTFFTGHEAITSNIVLSLFAVALFLPIYRAECVLGFVLAMTAPFGAVLPTVFATVMAAAGVILYRAGYWLRRPRVPKRKPST
ncbi:MAG TPA: hypothetical protein VH087_20745 [Thermoanaerobaculia bacterium]|jgi:hypothetical protein|nr:hypothetical protein [Thermoanaerobaculia bacterium]